MDIAIIKIHVSVTTSNVMQFTKYIDNAFKIIVMQVIKSLSNGNVIDYDLKEHKLLKLP